MEELRNPSRASDKTIRQALEEITAILQRQLRKFAQLEQQHHTVPPCFLAQLRSQPEAAVDATVLGNMIYLLHVTWGDVAGLLHWLLKMLSDHPDWVIRMRETTATEVDELEDGNDLGTRIVMETLRLEQSEHLYRTVLQDIHFAGFVIP